MPPPRPPSPPPHRHPPHKHPHHHPPAPPPPPSDFCAWCWHRTVHDCCTFRRPPHLQDEPVKYGAFVPVFLLKLLLEVLGAAGAVWGFSEVITLRDDDNAALFRGLSVATGVIFTVRLYWHAKHWLEHEHDFPYVKLHHRRQHVIHFMQVFGAKLLLQVAGAAGAIWGCSEAVGIRTAFNESAWRLAAVLTGLVFFLRWMIEILSYCLVFGNPAHEPPPRLRRSRQEKANPVRILVQQLRQHVLPWTELLIVKFVLEVCGAVGAVWGFTEIVMLRRSDDETSTQIWRVVSLVVGGILCVRWLSQVHGHCFGSDHTAAPLVTEPMESLKQSTKKIRYVPSPRRQPGKNDNEGNADIQDVEIPSSGDKENSGGDGLSTAPSDELALVETTNGDDGEADSYEHEEQHQTLPAIATTSIMESCSPKKVYMEDQ